MEEGDNFNYKVTWKGVIISVITECKRTPSRKKKKTQTEFKRTKFSALSIFLGKQQGISTNMELSFFFFFC